MIRAALERHLRAHGGPIPPVPFDPARAPDGRTVRIELLSDEGGGDAG